MTVTSKPSSPSPDPAEQKIGRGPSPVPADPDLSPSPDEAKRPGGQGKGARRIS